jgi:hypothetical protein
MTNHDVAVPTPSDDTSGERPNRSLADSSSSRRPADMSHSPYDSVCGIAYAARPAVPELNPGRAARCARAHVDTAALASRPRDA